MATPSEYVEQLRARSSEKPDRPTGLIACSNDHDRGPGPSVFDLDEANLLVEQQDGVNRTWHYRTEGHVIKVTGRTTKHHPETIRLMAYLSTIVGTIPVILVGALISEFIGSLLLGLYMAGALFVFPLVQFYPELFSPYERFANVRVLNVTSIDDFKQSFNKFFEALPEQLTRADLDVQDDMLKRIRPDDYELDTPDGPCRITPEMIELINESLQSEDTLFEQSKTILRRAYDVFSDKINIEVRVTL